MNCTSYHSTPLNVRAHGESELYLLLKKKPTPIQVNLPIIRAHYWKEIIPITKPGQLMQTLTLDKITLICNDSTTLNVIPNDYQSTTLNVNLPEITAQHLIYEFYM